MNATMSNSHSPGATGSFLTRGHSRFAVTEFTKDIYGRKFETSDGQTGYVKDFQINDKDWSIQYMVWTSGSWLPRNKRLVSQESFSHLISEDSFLGAAGTPPITATDRADFAMPVQTRCNGGARLLSSHMLSGYRIIAADGEFGSLGGLMVDLYRWEVPHLVIVTGRWYSHDQMLIDPKAVADISDRDRSITVGLSKDAIGCLST